ncbi:MAG: sigma-54-dependent Fis family transcriptional regulator [Bacteroidetes bacterium]|nr:sigma-54-dependent Fis family transcriptional regulator [Bacteroidota bacterium]
MGRVERTEVTTTNATKQVLAQLATRFGLVGESPLMMQAISRLLQVAPTDLTVLITGETGTGKEVFAHAVHELSQRKKAPFVSVNCGAIPETLLESELFGAEKGAYTGSVEQRKGFFETAHKGTIFLDEIGEMPIGTQVKLLRILESGEFSRLGSSDNLKVDVRVVAATNRDLSYEVRQGRFRQDLYFRLNSVNIVLPPLRQHPDDIPLLVEHFARKVAEKNNIDYHGIDADAAIVLETMPWQGNVRELRNIVETMVTLERGARITAEMIQRYLPPPQSFEEPRASQAIVRVADQASNVHDPDAQMIYRLLLQLTNDVNDMKTVLRHLVALSMESVTPTSTAIVKAPQDQPTMPVELNLTTLERTAIEEALRRSKGNRREAAEMLGISERTLYRKITEYQLD